MLLQTVQNSLDELSDLLHKISDRDYSKPSEELSGTSIGEHTRHIIEMFQCLLQQYHSGIINYDLRKRDLQMQSGTDYANEAIAGVKCELDRPDRKLLLQQQIDGNDISIDSNYFRELLYNLEHCIHHQALIKVGLRQCGNITVDKNFGVARSTIEYRKQCAQ